MNIQDGKKMFLVIFYKNRTRRKINRDFFIREFRMPMKEYKRRDDARGQSYFIYFRKKEKRK